MDVRWHSKWENFQIFGIFAIKSSLPSLTTPLPQWPDEVSKSTIVVSLNKMKFTRPDWEIHSGWKFSLNFLQGKEKIWLRVLSE